MSGAPFYDHFLVVFDLHVAELDGLLQPRLNRISRIYSLQSLFCQPFQRDDALGAYLDRQLPGRQCVRLRRFPKTCQGKVGPWCLGLRRS